ncbi:uncharacterized protein LOC121376896, partial [Gigantopelta aegis]|uniref:uncharacterized protein LOC121376896 n=1 Tax=Gigantopelta aegis TaxID=1735272 RepID=UPI001B88910F
RHPSTKIITERTQKLSWILVNRHHGEKFPNILTLVDLLLTIPAHSADCERGFSHMKIKSDWRSSLSPDLMRITLLSPPVEEYDPTAAMDLWFMGGEWSRRPYASVTQQESSNSGTDSD